MSNTSLLGAYGDNSGSALMFRNQVINGNFDVWQRGTSFTGVSPFYGPDRFQVFRDLQTAGATFSRVNNFNNDSIYYLRAQRDSGNTSTAGMNIGTSFETIDVYQFAGKQVTLQVKLLAGANFSSSTVAVSVVWGTGTNGNIGTGFTNQAIAFETLATPTTSWKTFNVTGIVPANATQLGVRIRYTPTGTAGVNDWIGITGVQLEAGPTATAFERRPFNTEFMLCQRYYQEHSLDQRAIGITPTAIYNTFVLPVRPRLDTSSGVSLSWSDGYGTTNIGDSPLYGQIQYWRSAPGAAFGWSYLSTTTVKINAEL